MISTLSKSSKSAYPADLCTTTTLLTCKGICCGCGVICRASVNILLHKFIAFGLQINWGDHSRYMMAGLPFSRTWTGWGSSGKEHYGIQQDNLLHKKEEHLVLYSWHCSAKEQVCWKKTPMVLVGRSMTWEQGGPKSILSCTTMNRGQQTENTPIIPALRLLFKYWL